jgi:hypothetical protein
MAEFFTEWMANNVKRPVHKLSGAVHLKKLSPLREYPQLFAAIVLDVWREKQVETTLQVAALKDRQKKLEWQKQQLIDAFSIEGI